MSESTNAEITDPRSINPLPIERDIQEVIWNLKQVQWGRSFEEEVLFKWAAMLVVHTMEMPAAAFIFEPFPMFVRPTGQLVRIEEEHLSELFRELKAMEAEAEVYLRIMGDFGVYGERLKEMGREPELSAAMSEWFSAGEAGKYEDATHFKLVTNTITGKDFKLCVESIRDKLKALVERH